MDSRNNCIEKRILKGSPKNKIFFHTDLVSLTVINYYKHKFIRCILNFNHVTPSLKHSPSMSNGKMRTTVHKLRKKFSPLELGFSLLSNHILYQRKGES